MKLSISVVTTSSTPRRARKRPGPINQAPPTSAGRERKRNQQRRRASRRGVADDGGDHSAEVEASFGADIEDPGAKGDRRREAGQQQRRRGRQSRRYAPLAAEGLFDHQSVDREWLMSGGRENDGADRDGEREWRGGGCTARQIHGPRGVHHAAFWPSIIRPTLSTLASLAAELANDPPIVEPDDPIGERENFVEHSRRSAGPRRHDRERQRSAVNEGDAGDVDAARRLRGDKQLRLAIEFARDDDTLLIAAGEAARWIAQAPVANRETRERALRAVVDGRGAAARRSARTAASRSRPATKLSRIEAVETKSFLAAIGAQIADARRAKVRCRGVCHVAAGEVDRPVRGLSAVRRRWRPVRPGHCRRRPQRRRFRPAKTSRSIGTQAAGRRMASPGDEPARAKQRLAGRTAHAAQLSPPRPTRRPSLARVRD